MVRAFVHLGIQLIHLAYLDEFGHVGPYVSRSDRRLSLWRHNDSPAFGFGGLVMPASEVRAFGTRFPQRKCELLDFEIRRSGKHPAVWGGGRDRACAGPPTCAGAAGCAS